MIKYIELPEFQKDFKSLQKRYRSMDSDFETFKKYSIEVFYEQKVPVNSFVKVEGFCNEKCISYKVRKFACKSLPGKGSNSGIRIIFIWQNIDGINTITFVEMYFKGDKAEEDRNRLRNILKNLSV